MQVEQSIPFENEHIRLEYRDGIVYGWYKSAYVDLELAKQIVQWRKEFTNFQTVKILLQQDGLKVIKREARVYLNSLEGVDMIHSAAIVARNPFEKHLANFFIQISLIKSQIPVKMFSDVSSADKWLKEQA